MQTALDMPHPSHFVSVLEELGTGCPQGGDDRHDAREVWEELGAEDGDHLAHHVQETLLSLQGDDTASVHRKPLPLPCPTTLTSICVTTHVHQTYAHAHTHTQTNKQTKWNLSFKVFSKESLTLLQDVLKWQCKELNELCQLIPLTATKEAKDQATPS